MVLAKDNMQAGFLPTFSIRLPHKCSDPIRSMSGCDKTSPPRRRRRGLRGEEDMVSAIGRYNRGRPAESGGSIP
jgi:hypothetical protein